MPVAGPGKYAKTAWRSAISRSCGMRLSSELRTRFPEEVEQGYLGMDPRASGCNPQPGEWLHPCTPTSASEALAVEEGLHGWIPPETWIRRGSLKE